MLEDDLRKGRLAPALTESEAQKHLDLAAKARRRRERQRESNRPKESPEFLESTSSPTMDLAVEPLADVSVTEMLRPLPQRSRRRSYGSIVSFLAFVVLPTIAAAVYYVGYASNQYVAEFRFSVRDITTAMATPPPAGTNPSTGSISTIASMFGASTGSNPTENYIVADYLTSRQAIDDLQKTVRLRDFYSRPTIDWWARFDASKPMEKFVRYWQNMVTANYDQITGIATAQVRAFNPEDAYLIANSLAAAAERLVNEISSRPQNESVRFAEKEVKRAEDRLKTARASLAEFRNKQGVIDPTTGVVPSNNLLTQNLRSQIVQYQTELSGLQQQRLSPAAPAIITLQAKIKAATDQLNAVDRHVGADSTLNKALSVTVGQFEQLNLERQFAENMVLATMQTLEQARAKAVEQHLYISPHVRPAIPEASLYPNRPIAILTVAIGSFLLWLVGLLIVRSIREHVA